MSNKAGVLATNLATTSNIVALTVKTLSKISDQQSIEVSQAARDILVTRTTQRIATQLRAKPIEG